jgi:hypothetical protein
MEADKGALAMEENKGALPMEADEGTLLPASHGGSGKQYAKSSLHRLFGILPAVEG